MTDPIPTLNVRPKKGRPRAFDRERALFNALEVF